MAKGDIELEEVRKQLDALNQELLRTLLRRSELVKEVAAIKGQHQLPALQPERFKMMIDSLLEKADEMNLDRRLVTEIFNAIHHSSLRQQNRNLQK